MSDNIDSKGFYCYDYNHISGIVDKIENYIYDCTYNHLTKKSKEKLLEEALESIRFIQKAFNDSRPILETVHFRIASEYVDAGLTAVPDEEKESIPEIGGA